MSAACFFFSLSSAFCWSKKYESPWVAIGYSYRRYKNLIFLKTKNLLLCSEQDLNSSLNSLVTFTKFPSFSVWDIDLFSRASEIMVLIASRFMVLITEIKYSRSGNSPDLKSRKKTVISSESLIISQILEKVNSSYFGTIKLTTSSLFST